MNFNALNIASPILRALEEQGYQTPTPIQERAIPPALKGRDVLGLAQTGTGKTCAFAVPILQRLNGDGQKGIRALILTPTRELAIQIGECFEAYGKYLPIKHTVIFGGVGQNPQVQALQSGVDVLVATPGRLQDLHDQGLVDVSSLRILVLDEADRMLDMGFIHDVRRILKWLPEKKQVMLFSATMPKEITNLVNSLLHNPARAAVDPVSSPAEAVKQRLYFVDKGNKTRLLAHILESEKIPSALVFTRTKHGANKVAGELEKNGISAAAIHGNKSQTARQAALAGFKDGTVRVLVATDIAARGLDIEELPFVFNYNLPEVPETYIHRIGRTGRAGHEGEAVSFCDFGEKPLLQDIEKLLGRKIEVISGHDWPMVILEEPKRDKHGKIINEEDQEARQAARERHAERKAAAEADEPKPEMKNGRKKKADKPAESPAPAPVEKTAEQQDTKRKKRSEKKPEPAVKELEEPEEEPVPVLGRGRREYTRPLRTKSLEEFLQADADDYDYSEFPLLAQLEKGGKAERDGYLDATDRLFATGSSRRTIRITSEQEIPQQAEEKHADRKKRSAREKSHEEAEQPHGEKKAVEPKKKPDAKPVRKAEKLAVKKASGKTEKAEKTQKPAEKKTIQSAKKERGHAKPVERKAEEKSAVLKINSRKKQGRRHDTPPETQRSIFATQKDSTEQRSLMKPYYIAHDDKD